VTAFFPVRTQQGQRMDEQTGATETSMHKGRIRVPYTWWGRQTESRSLVAPRHKERQVLQHGHGLAGRGASRGSREIHSPWVPAGDSSRGRLFRFRSRAARPRTDNAFHHCLEEAIRPGSGLECEGKHCLRAIAGGICSTSAIFGPSRDRRAPWISN